MSGMPAGKRRIALASDHAGFDLKQTLSAAITDLGHDVLDLGTDDAEKSVDYPDFGIAIANAVATSQADCGIAVCGTGIGISLAANRIRAALCHNATTARLARRHNDANILALGSRIIGTEVALDCLRSFLETEFEGGRHARRIAKLSVVS
jgi:ribose 5-phosphate isomerase B